MDDSLRNSALRAEPADRDLLELAAKAADIMLADEVDSYMPGSRAMWVVGQGGRDVIWNPLNDSGDALRLAMKLRLDISHALDAKVEVSNQRDSEDQYRWAWEPYGEDAGAAVRRAIVRTAAAIGANPPAVNVPRTRGKHESEP